MYLLAQKFENTTSKLLKWNIKLNVGKEIYSQRNIVRVKKLIKSPMIKWVFWNCCEKGLSFSSLSLLHFVSDAHWITTWSLSYDYFLTATTDWHVLHVLKNEIKFPNISYFIYVVKGGCSYKLWSYKNKSCCKGCPQQIFRNYLYWLSLLNSVNYDGKSRKEPIRYLFLGMLRNKITKETQIFLKKVIHDLLLKVQ